MYSVPKILTKSSISIISAKQNKFGIISISDTHVEKPITTKLYMMRGYLRMFVVL